MPEVRPLLPELAQREVRLVRLGTTPGTAPEIALPPDEYAYLESCCEDLNRDCRRVFLQAIAKGQPGKVFASISYGWEKESFYRKRMPWDPTPAPLPQLIHQSINRLSALG